MLSKEVIADKQIINIMLTLLLLKSTLEAVLNKCDKWLVKVKWSLINELLT
jgi:hypothetical protein